jgi:hypothetical protein
VTRRTMGAWVVTAHSLHGLAFGKVTTCMKGGHFVLMHRTYATEIFMVAMINYQSVPGMQYYSYYV